MAPIQSPSQADIPRQFYCPLDLELMPDAVTAPDGFSYRKKAWEAYERSRRFLPFVSPMTRAVMPRRPAVPNLNLRALIRECEAAQPRLAELEREALAAELRETEGRPRIARVLHTTALAARRLGNNAVTQRLEPVAAWATLAATTAAGGFLFDVVGLMVGWTGAQLQPVVNPASWWGANRYDGNVAHEVARMGARLGLCYGLVAGARVGLQYDTLENASQRAFAQWAGLSLGIGFGSFTGMLLGVFVGPVACFTLNTCSNDSLDEATINRVSHVGSIVGALAGIMLGLELASQIYPARRRR